MTDGRVIDVNTRKNSYAYELPLLVPHVENNVNYIHPSDLELQLVDGMLVITSKNLKKVIIPRFSSAYNYHAHGLPLLRFLCDLQHQSLKTNLTLDMTRILPGLNYYPRVVYRSCILYPATWYLKDKDFKHIFDSRFPDIALKIFLEKYSIPNLFKIVENDQSLLINVNSSEDISMLVNQLKKVSSVTIREALPLSELVTDYCGRPVASELIAAVINQSPSYMGSNVSYTRKKYKQVKRVFQTCDQWVYYKLYCMTLSSDEIMSTDLYRLIKSLFQKDLINEWFFIRYHDPDPHLRVRFKLQRKSGEEVIKLFNKYFDKRVIKGNISRILLVPYERELERYGSDVIAEVENVFFKCSNFIINYLHAIYSNKAKLPVFEIVVMSVDELLGIYTENISVKEILMNAVITSIGRELDLNKSNIHQLNEKYRELKVTIHQCLTNPEKSIILNRFGFNEFKEAYSALNSKLMIKEAKRAEVFLRDIIHLHINRIFSEEQRTQEFVLSFYLKKYYHSVQKQKHV
jgi:thiopeptide-type bacteriocin biosynthesis protein